MGYGTLSHRFDDGRRPTVDVRAIHERLRARLGPSVRAASAVLKNRMR
jgi:hypothetical protein